MSIYLITPTQTASRTRFNLAFLAMSLTIPSQEKPSYVPSIIERNTQPECSAQESNSLREHLAEEDMVTLKIQDIASLPMGWDYGVGETASKKVVNRAMELYELSKKYSLEVEPLPKTSGGITLTFNKAESDKFLVVDINPDLQLDYCVEKGIGFNYDVTDEQENVNINAIEEGFKQLT